MAKHPAVNVCKWLNFLPPSLVAHGTRWHDFPSSQAGGYRQDQPTTLQPNFDFKKVRDGARFLCNMVHPTSIGSFLVGTCNKFVVYQYRLAKCWCSLLTYPFTARHWVYHARRNHSQNPSSALVAIACSNMETSINGEPTMWDPAINKASHALDSQSSIVNHYEPLFNIAIRWLITRWLWIKITDGGPGPNRVCGGWGPASGVLLLPASTSKLHLSRSNYRSRYLATIASCTPSIWSFCWSQLLGGYKTGN